MSNGSVLEILIVEVAAAVVSISSSNCCYCSSAIDSVNDVCGC